MNLKVLVVVKGRGQYEVGRGQTEPVSVTFTNREGSMNKNKEISTTDQFRRRNASTDTTDGYGMLPVLTSSSFIQAEGTFT